MAESIQLNVTLNENGVTSSLTKIDDLLTRIRSSGAVKVKVSSTGLKTAAKDAQDLASKLNSAAAAAQQFNSNGPKGFTNTSQAAQNATQSAQQFGSTATQAFNSAGQAAQSASRNAISFNNGLTSVVGTMFKFRLASTAINLAISAIKDGVREMKEVDQEMVNIRKVTGFTNDQIKELSANAYTLATQYGRSASEVLEASTVFARAGYTDQIAQLSELSLLLQNVGDLQADEASKFIIATDKAFKLGGSYEDLMGVIDGLDKITNRNATDMQKLTEGMTVAGSVFAESGESLEMFAALLGTVTANTQRSGSEMARGLRTILMNLRQIRVAKDENGDIITGESGAAAAKALRDYAGISTMENGELRKASDVLADLAEKWDTLTETQKAAISEAVAGKRQANILMTLMGDWDSVAKMMSEYETAAGTALSENDIYMESWTAKLTQVKSAWEELFQTLVDADVIPHGLDAVIDLIKSVQSIAETEVVQKFLHLFFQEIQWIADGIGETFESIDYLFSGVDKRVEKAEKDYRDATKIAESARQELIDDFGDGSRYAELIANVDNLTASEKVELAQLEAQLRTRQALVEMAEREADAAERKLQAELQAQADAREKEAAKANRKVVSDLAAVLPEIQNAFANGQDISAYTDSLYGLIDAYSDYYAKLNETKASGVQLTKQEERFVDVYKNLAAILTDGGNAIEFFGKLTAMEYFASGQDLESSINTANEQMGTLSDTIGEIPDVVTISVNVEGASAATSILEGLARAAGAVGGTGAGGNSLGSKTGGRTSKHASGARSAQAGPSLVNEFGPELISANGLAWIAGGGKPTVTMLPKGATVLTAQQTRAAFGGGIPAFANGGTYRGYTPLTPGDFTTTAQEDAAAAAAEASAAAETAATAAAAAADAASASYGTRPSGRKTATSGTSTGVYRRGDGQGTGPVGKGSNAAAVAYQPYTEPTGPLPPNFKALEQELSDALKKLGMQAELAENEGDLVRVLQIYGEAQDLIAELLEKYRANGYAEDSEEVLRLANLGYDYASKQLGTYDDLQKQLIDALNALNETTEDANALQEKQEAVDKAREALKNAERQRTVRIFNPVTGQWEWVANAADVEKAREALAKAEKDLQDEQFSQTLDAIKNAKPGDLADMTLAPAVLDKLFSASPELQSAFLNALGAATGGADYMASDEAKTAWNQGNIGTQYNLNGITLTEAQASGMTIKELIAMLQGLKIM